MARTLPSRITSLLLLLLLSPPPISSTSTTATTVFDYYGNPVKPGTRYYFFFLGTGYFFGTLTMISKPNGPKCPKYVTVSDFLEDLGPGVEFYPTNPSQETITTSTDLNIIFSGSSNCSSGKPVWQLTRDTTSGGGIVTTDGEIGDQKTLFKIEKSKNPWDVMRYDLTYNDKELMFYHKDLETYYIWLGLGINDSADHFRFSLWPASTRPPVELARPYLRQSRAMA